MSICLSLVFAGLLLLLVKPVKSGSARQVADTSMSQSLLKINRKDCVVLRVASELCECVSFTRHLHSWRALLPFERSAPLLACCCCSRNEQEKGESCEHNASSQETLDNSKERVFANATWREADCQSSILWSPLDFVTSLSRVVIGCKRHNGSQLDA